MSELRNQLDAARAEHRAARYPGDLAAEVLGGGGGNLAVARRRWWIGAAVSGAVAAGIALVVMVSGPGVGPVEENRQVAATDSEEVQLPEAPEMPPMPMYQPLSGIGPEPEMPSFFDVM